MPFHPPRPACSSWACRVDRQRLAVVRGQGRSTAELAELLVRVSARESYAGDHAGALDSITEAVAIRRALAQTNPAAFLPDLATSLNNLTRLAPADTSDDTWQRATNAFAQPSARAVLRTAWASWLISVDRHDAARDQLKQAADEAGTPVSLEAR